jgi:hypothetical protein
MVQELHALLGERAFNPHQVFLLDLGVRADQPLRDAAILGEHDEARGIDIQAARRCEPAQVAVHELGPRRILGPVVLGLDEHHRGLVAVLGLARHIADRLVEEDRHLLALVTCRRWIDLDFRIARDAHAQRSDDLAVHLHPAVLDPFVGFAA